MKTKKILALTLIVSSLFLGGCLKKKSDVSPTPTPTPRLIELSDQNKPQVSITPSDDNHWITINISQIADFISEIEYELIYTAVDQGLEIEKGVGDTVKVEGSSFERKLLLGTASCTTTCKYKYDEGVTGGVLTLTLVTQQGQIASLETPFSL